MGDFYSEKRVIANKEHKCYWCKETIPKNEPYFRVAGVFEGYFSSRKECVNCNYLVMEYSEKYRDDVQMYGIDCEDLMEFKKNRRG